MQIKLVKPLILVLALSGLSLGCQTNEIKAFSKVQPGMDKGDVIDIMGSPQHSERWHGRDRWTYVFYHEDSRFEKEVQFSGGKSLYVGDVVKPAVSAEEQDRINEESNQALAAAMAAEKADNRKNSAQYHEGASTNSTEIRYVPEFKPVQ